MKPVCKYNLYKGVSTVLTVGTPIITLISCSDLFVHRSDTAMSAAGMFTLLIAALFFKDKIMEKFKVPSAFVISLVSLILICVVESILVPVKYVCIATMIASGIDELTFKRFYKMIESTMPENINLSKRFGFIFGSSDKLLGGIDGKRYS